MSLIDRGNGRELQLGLGACKVAIDKSVAARALPKKVSQGCRSRLLAPLIRKTRVEGSRRRSRNKVVCLFPCFPRFRRRACGHQSSWHQDERSRYFAPLVVLKPMTCAERINFRSSPMQMAIISISIVLSILCHSNSALHGKFASDRPVVEICLHHDSTLLESRCLADVS